MAASYTVGGITLIHLTPFDISNHPMSKEFDLTRELLPYEAPTLSRLELSEPLSVLVNFSLELDFEDFEEEDEF